MHLRRFLLLVALAALALLAVGCRTWTRARERTSSQVATNSAALTEESRALTTGALDSLQRVPASKSPPVDLARKLLVRDQAIEGLPVTRIDVDAVLAGQSHAIRTLERRLDGVDGLIRDREVLRLELEQANARLIELGERYEAERSRSLWRRIIGGFGFTGGIAALLALIVFFPPALMILTRIVGFLVARLPQLAGVFGVVTTRAFDGVVASVEAARSVIRKRHGAEAEEQVLAEMSRTMDRREKSAVRTRKAALPVTPSITG